MVNAVKKELQISTRSNEGGGETKEMLNEIKWK